MFDRDITEGVAWLDALLVGPSVSVNASSAPLLSTTTNWSEGNILKGSK